MTTTLTDKMLGHYSLRREAGHGAMSAVYEGVDTRLGRAVAVKVLKTPSYLSPEKQEEMVQRMRREARAIGRLSHPNVVTIFDVGEEDGVHYLVMEYLDGVTLRQRMNASPLPPGEAADVLDQVAAGLDAVHAQGVVHRDLKPSNVMLLPDGRVKLMDFGVARAGDETAMTQMGTMVGSPSYMSPEQVRGESATPASDLWSLGVLLYEMLTGRPAFTGDSLPAVLYKVVHDEPAPLPESLSSEIGVVLRKAIERDPARRFPSASAFAEAFRSALRLDSAAAVPAATVAAAAAHVSALPSENDTVAAVPVPPPPLAALPPLLPPPSPRPTAAVTATRRRSSLAGPVAAILALLTIGGGGAMLVSRQQEAAQENDRLVTSTRDSTAPPVAAPSAPGPASEQNPIPSAVRLPSEDTGGDVWEPPAPAPGGATATPRPEQRRAESAPSAQRASEQQQRRTAASSAARAGREANRQASAAPAGPAVTVPAPGPRPEPAVVTAQEVAKETRPAARKREQERTSPPARREEEPSAEPEPQTAENGTGREEAPGETTPSAEIREEAARDAQSELRSLLKEWIDATNAGDIEWQMRFYPPMMTAYYRERGVMRSEVRTEKLRVFGGAELIRITAGTPKITFSDNGRTATMRFRKDYVIQGRQGTNRGAVLQELRWRRNGDGEWKIISERDLRVLG